MSKAWRRAGGLGAVATAAQCVFVVTALSGTEVGPNDVQVAWLNPDPTTPGNWEVSLLSWPELVVQVSEPVPGAEEQWLVLAAAGDYVARIYAESDGVSCAQLSEPFTVAG